MKLLLILMHGLAAASAQTCSLSPDSNYFGTWPIDNVEVVRSLAEVLPLFNGMGCLEAAFRDNCMVVEEADNLCWCSRSLRSLTRSEGGRVWIHRDNSDLLECLRSTINGSFMYKQRCENSILAIHRPKMSLDINKSSSMMCCNEISCMERIKRGVPTATYFDMNGCYHCIGGNECLIEDQSGNSTFQFDSNGLLEHCEQLVSTREFLIQKSGETIALDEWNEWEKCNVSCGGGGTRIRDRYVFEEIQDEFDPTEIEECGQIGCEFPIPQCNVGYSAVDVDGVKICYKDT